MMGLPPQRSQNFYDVDAFFGEGKDFYLELSRGVFNEICKKVFNKAILPIKAAL